MGKSGVVDVTIGKSPRGNRRGLHGAASSSNTRAAGSGRQQPALPAACSRSIPSWIHWTRQHGESNSKKISLNVVIHSLFMMYLHAEFQDADEQVVSSPAAGSWKKLIELLQCCLPVLMQ